MKTFRRSNFFAFVTILMAFGAVEAKAADGSGSAKSVGKFREFAAPANARGILRISEERRFVELLQFNQAEFCNCTPVNIARCAKRASQKTQERLSKSC